MISYVGYVTQVIPVSGKTTINAIMIEDFTEIDQVVVIGYGSRTKATVTGSVASISGDEMLKSHAANISTGLAGQIPGLVMLGRGGDAREYVLPIRQRALLPDESLPAVLTMDDIMHERRIELAYEDHRFFDVRRWKILDQTFVDVYKVDVHTDRTVDPEVKTYKYS